MCEGAEWCHHRTPLFFCEHGACSLETWHDLVCSTVAVHAVLLQSLLMVASSQPPLKMMALSGVFSSILGESEA